MIVDHLADAVAIDAVIDICGIMKGHKSLAQLFVEGQFCVPSYSEDLLPSRS